MKLQLKNTLLSVFVLAFLVGCGASNGGGNLPVSYGEYGAQEVNYYLDTARGLPGSLKSADELSEAIVNNNFSRSSFSGYGNEYPIYTIDSFSPSSTSQDCDDFDLFGVSLGKVCTSSSSGSNNISIGGYRGLNHDGSIARSNQSLDGAFGSTIAELASFLASRVQESDANKGLFKYVETAYGVGYAPYKDGMCSDANWVKSYYYGNRYFCENVAQVSTSRWMITVNGKKMIIDMNRSLIEQPLIRATKVGVSAY